MRIGAAETSSRLTAGSLISAGSLKRVCATRSRTSVAASWMSVPSLKKITVVERLSREYVCTRSMPLSETTASSRGFEIWFSISFGLAPG